MTSTRPMVHPITGGTFPRRSTLRRITDNCLGPLGADFTDNNNESTGVADGRLGRTLRTPADGSQAWAGLAHEIPVGTNAHAIQAVGIHVSGLRVGSTTGPYPTNPDRANVALSLAPAAGGDGIILIHRDGEDYASFYRLGTGGGDTFIDGSNGQTLSFRTQRSTSIGFMYDYVDQEAIVYTMDADGVVRSYVQMRRPLANFSVVQPRLQILNPNTNTSVRAQYTRMDIDLWTD